MSDPTYSDPAAPQRGGVGVSAPDAYARDAPRSGAGGRLIANILRRWWLIALCVGIGVIGAFVYLATATKVYTATAVLSAELPNGAGTPAGRIPPDEFLYQQRNLIRSPQVLAAAATPTTAAAAANIRDALDVSVSRDEGVIGIAYDAATAETAARGANAIADAYLRLRAQQQTGTVTGLTELTKERDRLSAEREAINTRLRQFREAGRTAGSDAERIAAAQLEQLRQAVTAAEVELTQANAAAAAGRELLADPAKLRHIVEANRNKGIFDRLEAHRAPIEAELAELRAQQERQREAMLPQHPVVVATQRKIDQLRARLADLDRQYAEAYLTHLEQQRATAQKRVEELRQLVAAQAEEGKAYAARAARLAEIEAELAQADAAIAAVDEKIRGVTLTAGAAAAPTVKLVVPAEPPARPSRPDRDRTFLSAAAIGLLAGLLLAAIIPRRS